MCGGRGGGLGDGGALHGWNVVGSLFFLAEIAEAQRRTGVDLVEDGGWAQG